MTSLPNRWPASLQWCDHCHALPALQLCHSLDVFPGIMSLACAVCAADCKRSGLVITHFMEIVISGFAIPLSAQGEDGKAKAKAKPKKVGTLADKAWLQQKEARCSCFSPDKMI